MNDMEKRFEIRLAGSGGQGLLLAGLILAEAAAIYDGKNAVQTQSYAPAARGGASSSDVIISDGEIDYPKVLKPNLLLALSTPGYASYFRDMRKDGILVVDSTMVEHVESGRANSVRSYALPIAEIARKATGRELTASMVALGIVVELTQIVSVSALLAAVEARSPRGAADWNKRAVQAGIESVAGLRKDRSTNEQNKDN